MSARTYCDLCKTYHEPQGCVMSRGLEALFGQPFTTIEREAMLKRIAELQAELGKANAEVERLDRIILNANKERCKYEQATGECSMSNEFQKGDIVFYHPIIGGPPDGKEYEIVDFGSINGDRDVCWLLGKRGCVSTKAISPARPQSGLRSAF